MLFSLKIDFALVISILSFIWAGITFYLTFFRRGKIKLAPIRLYAISTIKGQNVSIVLPMTFINVGARLTAVEDVKIKIIREDKQTLNHIEFIWQTETDAVPPTTKPVFAGQFVVPPYGSVSRNCGFVCMQPKFRLVGGRVYECVIEVQSQLKKKDVARLLIEVREDSIPGMEKGLYTVGIGASAISKSLTHPSTTYDDIVGRSARRGTRKAIRALTLGLLDGGHRSKNSAEDAATELPSAIRRSRKNRR